MRINEDITRYINISRNSQKELNDLFNDINNYGIDALPKNRLFFLLECFVGKILDINEGKTEDIVDILVDNDILLQFNNRNDRIHLIMAIKELIKLYNKVK